VIVGQTINEGKEDENDAAKTKKKKAGHVVSVDEY